MKNTYSGARERILHAASVKEAEAVFGSLTGYPTQYINRCKRALERTKLRLDKPIKVVKNEPAPQVSEAKEWSPGSDAPGNKKSKDPLFNKRGKKK